MKSNIFQFAVEELEKGNPVLWATIFRRVGSAPRGAGARMVINSQGQFQGTIGGGRLEAGIQANLGMYLQEKKPVVLDYRLSEKDAADLDMICGGNVTVLVEPVFPDQEDLVKMYRQAQRVTQEQKNGWFMTPIPKGGSQEKMTLRSLVDFHGNVWGNWLSEAKVTGQQIIELTTIDGKNIDLREFSNFKSPQVMKIDQSHLFLEPIGEFSTVYLVGAGHIAHKLAPLTRMVGFRTVVADDRVDLLTHAHFPQADQFVVLDGFKDVFSHCIVDTDSYVVIVTRGHSSDKDVLGQALQTQAAYIGMIGSRRKIQATFKALQDEGWAEEAFKRVHSPIGLDIGAETPEEIAISIVAELIQARANKLKTE